MFVYALLRPIVLFCFLKTMAFGWIGSLAVGVGVFSAYMVLTSSFAPLIGSCFALQIDCGFWLTLFGAFLLICIGHNKIRMFYVGYARRKGFDLTFMLIKTSFFAFIISLLEHMRILGNYFPLSCDASYGKCMIEMMPMLTHIALYIGSVFVVVFLVKHFFSNSWLNILNLFAAVALFVIGIRLLPDNIHTVFIAILYLVYEMGMEYKMKRVSR